jgi:flagellar motor switch protein FliG
LENKSRAETFIGFAIRTGRCRIGLNAVETLKRADVVIVCKTTAENSREKAKKLAVKFNCPLVVTVNKTLEQITHKENAKVMAIYDKKLTKAFLGSLEQEFIAENLEK